MSNRTLLKRLEKSFGTTGGESRSITLDLTTAFHQAYPEAKRSGGEFLILCHEHKDTNPSLSVNLIKGVWYCLVCKAGGTLTSLPRLRDLTVERVVPEAEYLYTDPDGKPVCRKLRYPGKRFVWERLEGERWIRGLDGLKLPYLYNLPAVLSSTNVILVEGEKDAHNVTQAGFVATTPPNGARHWRPEFSEALRGRSLVIIPDNDSPGYQHAVELIKQLWNVAISIGVAIVEGDEGMDASDVLARDGEEGLRKLIRSAKPVGQGVSVFQIQDFVDLALRDREIPTRYQRLAVASVINSFRSREKSTVHFSQRRLGEELGLKPREVGDALREAQRLGYWQIQGTRVGTRLTIRWEELEVRFLRVLAVADVATRELE